MAEVRIDGELYVPATTTDPTTKRFVDALVRTWAGDNWEKWCPDAPSFLRVVVTDDEEDGENLMEFVARMIHEVPL